MKSSDHSESTRAANGPLDDVGRRLRDLIAAIDERAPHAEDASEPSIARDAALLRQKAVTRLAEVAAEKAPDTEEA